LQGACFSLISEMEPKGFDCFGGVKQVTGCAHGDADACQRSRRTGDTSLGNEVDGAEESQVRWTSGRLILSRTQGFGRGAPNG
jgi:hypothetical protein